MKALTLTFALLLLCTGAALASTPDGQTPAEETVCDSETGAAFGLCNAYCEAMDCESEDPQASETACTKVRGKFMNITGRDLPCEAPPATCPCLGQSSFDLFLTTATSCVLNDPAFGIMLKFVDPEFPVTGFSFSDSDGAPRCGYDYFLQESFHLDITAAEAQVCNQALLDAAAALNLTCQ